MNRRKRMTLISILSFIFIIINILIIYDVNKPNNFIFEESNDNQQLPHTPIFNQEKERNLGNFLGLNYGYSVPENTLYVKPINLASYEKGEKPIINLINTTSYSVDIESLINRDYITEKYKGEEPIVLIIHTHGTESFVPNNKNYYFTDTEFNSTDIKENIVAVGDVFCEILKLNNIPYIHDKTMFDENSYKLSYKNSGIAVSDYLEKYPTIKYIIDIHRDTICDKNNINQKPLTVINGVNTAQIMFVVGTNAGGANHPNWKDNLTVVLKYQEIINKKYPTLARPIYLHTSSFNQFNMPTMMLLEIGASGNTLNEAKNAAKLAAECLVEFIELY